MRYLLALVFPPLAVFSCGKGIQTVLNLLLTLCCIVPGILHALLVVHSYEADQRTKQLMKVIKEHGVG